MAAILKLESNDAEVFDVEVNVACQSKVLKVMLEDTGDIADDDDPVPLPNVNGATLRKVIAWCTQHQNDNPVEEENTLEASEPGTDNLDSWDKDFFKVDQGILFELILAANYLDIKSLLVAACKTVANFIKGKTTEEIRKTFNIVNDFSPEEEEEIRKENAWCEDK
ncbi:S-phase kinase-associated protein 1-like [Sycon ciliatum]|uniref:S-phase kinase-associated protein 1-like n=1 Tax=Sycon ciliatum TaxID=27933 RepID=UPI0031F6D0AA